MVLSELETRGLIVVEQYCLAPHMLVKLQSLEEKGQEVMLMLLSVLLSVM